MTIVCTKEQKKSFIWQAEMKIFCPFMAEGMIDCCNNCGACLEKNIDWEITDEVTDNNCGTCKYKEQIKAIMDILKNAEKNKENENDKSSNRDT